MFVFFFFNDTATTEIYTLSLHDALPICWSPLRRRRAERSCHKFRSQSSLLPRRVESPSLLRLDRKSTRLNSSHSQISYAVFCLKKKKTHITPCTHCSITQTLSALSLP